MNNDHTYQQPLCSPCATCDESNTTTTRKRDVNETKTTANDAVRCVPKLRFPEFQNAGEWKFVYGNELFVPTSNKNHNSDLPILAISQEYGAIPRIFIDYNIIVSEESISGYKVVEMGDFIISLRSFQGGIEYSSYKGLCSPAYIILQKRDNTIYEIFYKYYFKSYQYIQELNRKLEGIRDGKMVSYQQFSEIPIPYPLYGEQQKIALCLQSIDGFINITDRDLKLLQTHKKALMQKLFPQRGKSIPEFRFPEFMDAGLWEEKRMGEIFKRIKDKNKKNIQNVLTISAQYGLISQYDYFHKNVAASDVSNYYLLKKGDFAYNKSRSQGYLYGTIKPLKLYNEGVVSTLYICFKQKNNKYCNAFFEQYFETELMNDELGKIAQEGARHHGLLNISTDDFFEKVVVLVPTSVNEQKKIASCFRSIDDEICALMKKLELLQMQKKALIQQLFVKY